MIDDHERKRKPWLPSHLLGALDDARADGERRESLRLRASSIPDPVRVALLLGLLTEEGLPHFHRLLATRLGVDGFWHRWNCLWTAEEDRHGAVLHDYCRDARLLHEPSVERLQFEYLKVGFEPPGGNDPYAAFVYTTLQERATQIAHANCGKHAADHEPLLEQVLARVAADEALHYAFYRQVFAEVLARDPERALPAAARVMGALNMPGRAIAGFAEMADVVGRAGIYGPDHYLEIVEEQIRYWGIEAMTGLGETGRVAQAKILALPAALRRAARVAGGRSAARRYRFDAVHGREIRVP